MSFIDRLRSAFLLRPVIGVHRELRRLNDNVEAVMAHFDVKTLRLLRQLEKEADAEAAMIEKNPGLLSGPTKGQEMAEALRERSKAGDPIDPAELLAASERLQEEESTENVAW